MARYEIVSKDCSGTGTPVDFFKKPDSNASPAGCTTPPALVHTATVNEGTSGNILALVITINKSLLTSGGPILGVWGATTKPGGFCFAARLPDGDWGGLNTSRDARDGFDGGYGAD